MTSIIKPTTSIDFPQLWKKALIVSGSIVAISLLALVFRGLNLGIDFEGGTSFELVTEATTDDVASVLPDLSLIHI